MMGQPMRRVLVAGMGNVLRYDDGVGVAVARRLAEESLLPNGARVIEIGIGGIHLVQELMTGYNALIIVDAIEQGSKPGTVHLLTAEVDDLSAWDDIARSDFLADMHYTTPSKALILARALGVLPPAVFIAGCQPGDADEMGIGLTPAVADSVAHLTDVVRGLAARLLASDPALISATGYLIEAGG